MSINTLTIMFAILSLIFGGLVFFLLLNIFNKVNNRVDYIETKREDFNDVAKKMLKTEFQDVESSFEEAFSSFETKIISEMRDIKDVKQKLALKEALELLKRQDEEWFTNYFSSTEPDDAIIEQVYMTDTEQSTDKYAEFIEIIKSS